MTAKIIAILNQKGGVGKTTTVISLASILSERYNKRVLVVDLDPQSNLTTGLGINKETIKKTSYDLLTDTSCLAVDCIVETKYLNLFIIPTTIDLSGAEVELSTAIARENRIKKALEKVRDQFDYIIIDCSPSLGLLTVNALNAAQECIVPMQPEYYSIEGLSHVINTINLIKDNLNSELKLSGIVMTMIDSRSKLHKDIVASVRTELDDMVYVQTIPRSIKLSESSGFGKSIIDYDKGSSGALAYIELVKEIFKNDLVNKEENKEDENVGQ